MQKFPHINKFLTQGKFQQSALISVTQTKSHSLSPHKTTTAGYTPFEAELN